METKELKQLIELLESSDLETLSYKNKNFEFEISKKSNRMTEREPIYQQVDVKNEILDHAPQQEGVIIKSPLVGIFYSRPSIDANPYVSIGDQVNSGDSICIVEAMKVMNEIKSTLTGKVVEIFVKDGDPVDYDQPLFRIVWERFKKFW